MYSNDAPGVPDIGNGTGTRAADYPPGGAETSGRKWSGSGHVGSSLAGAAVFRCASVADPLSPDRVSLERWRVGRACRAWITVPIRLPRVHLPCRKARTRAGKNFTNFLPAISKAAFNKISGEARRWRLHRRTRHRFIELT
jgi:hypothetical protein